MLKVKQRVKDSPNFDMEEYFKFEGYRDEDGCYLFGREEYISKAVESRQSNPCGTAACIAGEAVLLAYEEGVNYLLEKGVYPVAKDYLGLSCSEAEWLFMGEFSPRPLHAITKEEAIRAIDSLIEGTHKS